MMESLNRASTRAYFKIKQKYEEFMQNEDGLETVETVILVVVAIVIALGVINVLTGDDGKSGIISRIGELIIKKISDAFDVAET